MSDESDSDSDASSDAEDGLQAGRGGRAGSGPGTLAPGSDSQNPVDAQVLGTGGIGYVWAALSTDSGAADLSSDDDSEGDSDFGAHDSGASARRQLHKLHTIGSTLDDAALGGLEEEDESDDGDDEDDEHVAEKLTPQEEFERELHLTIKRACDENLSASKATLEIKSLRMSYRKDKDVMREYVMQEILRTIDVAALATSVPAVFKKWGPVISEYIGDGREQLDLLDTVERHFALEEDIDGALRSRLFVRSVYMLYQLDVVEDVAVIAWHGRAQKRPSTEVSPELLRALEPIVNDLNETDEESDDEDEDEDEDEESNGDGSSE
ncbi:translation initiation factor eIF-2B epsilon subunit, GEF [Coemansia spiralis]|nr:translation initiation factor eIF-2B epsilon subunit, GEF [Coemansia spiralis]